MKVSKFRTGDKVVVKTYPISYDEENMPEDWVVEMYEYMGKTLTITSIDDEEPTIYLENGYWYHHYQVIPFEEYERDRIIKKTILSGDLFEL